MPAIATGGTGLAWATLSSPVGPLAVACSPAGVTQVRFRHSPGGRPPQPGPARPPGPAGGGDPGGGGDPAGGSDPEAEAGRPTAGELAGVARDQLAEYFAGQRQVFDLPIDWSAASDAQRHVLSVLFETIGYGQTVTYGDLARRTLPGLGEVTVPARAIGRIMGANPVPVIVPCHRVVAGNGLGGYSGGTGIEVKRWLLTFEGALPATLDWDPAGAALR